MKVSIATDTILQRAFRMEKVDLTKQFSFRLRDAMIAAGFNSKRSSSGVSIHKLAEITNHSIQICRKYLRGETLPEPIKLVEIAKQLNVSPGWLLFGESSNDILPSNEKITISKKLLYYIFTQIENLYNSSHSNTEVTNFLLELVTDVSQINTDEEQLKKIIDLALSSIRRFNSR